MLSPALTVVISLLLVAAIGYLIGSATGKRSATQTSSPLLRRIQRESDELNRKILETESERDALRAQLEGDGGGESAGAAEELERRDEALGEIRARLVSTQSEVDALRSEKSALEHRLVDRQTALDITTSDREVHAGRLQEVTQELETLRRQLAESTPGVADANGGGDDALRRDVDQLRNQLNNQGGQLREALQALAARDDETHRLRDELEAAQTNSLALEADTDSQALGVRSTDDAVRAAVAELEEARATIIEQETRHNDELQWRNSRITELEATPQTASETETWLAEVRAALTQSETERAALALERDEATHRLAAVEDQISGGGERVARLRDELDELERRYGQQVRELDDEVQLLRQKLEERNEEMQRLRDERQHSGERIDRDGEQLRQASVQIDTLVAERDELAASLTALTGDFEARAEALRAARDEARTLENDYVVQIERRDQQLKEMQSRADSVGTRLLDTEEQGRAQVLQIEELNDSLQALESRMARSGERRVELDRLVAELTEESQRQVEESEAGFAERDATIERFEQRLAQQTEMLARRDQQVKNDRERIESLQAEIEERTAATERSIRERDLEMDRLRRTLEAQLDELRTSDETVKRLEQEITGLRATLDQERTHAMDAQAQLGTRVSELQAAETTQARSNAMVESVRAEMADLEASFERRLRERQLELDGIAGMLRDREAELTESLLQIERAKADEEVAKARIERRDARIEALDAEMLRSDDTRERLLRELHEREIEGRQMRSLLRVEPPAGDDLTAIRGIGAKTAGLLNGAGIFTYGQIASWDQTDVEWIEAREPRLVGRIRLDEWVRGGAGGGAGRIRPRPRIRINGIGSLAGELGRLFSELRSAEAISERSKSLRRAHPPQSFGRYGDGIRTQCRQVAKKQRVLPALGQRRRQRLSTSDLHLPGVGLERDRFEIAVLMQHRRGGFGAPASDTRIAISAVANERQVVGNRARQHTELGQHAVTSSHCPRSTIQLHDAIIDDALGQVFVGRTDEHAAYRAVGRKPVGGGSQRIIGLVLAHRPHDDAHRLQCLFERFELCQELGIDAVAALVALPHLIAKRLDDMVRRDTDVGRAVT